MRLRWAYWGLVGLAVLAIGLCAASVATLWSTGSRVIQRERSRAGAARSLGSVGEAMARNGEPFWVFIPAWPNTRSKAEWQAIDQTLSAEVAAAIGDEKGVEAGFFLPLHERYLGRSETGNVTEAVAGDADPSPAVAGAVRAQIRVSIEKGQPSQAIGGPASAPFLVGASPVLDEQGQVVAVSWAVVNLDGPLFLDRSAAEGYRAAASMALVGIGLALSLTLALAWGSRRLVRERRRLQVELRRSERLAALGKLLAGVAHEVRNPLAGIRSSAQLWQRGIGPDPASIAAVVAEVDRLDGLVGQLLRFTRPGETRMIPGDLNLVISQAADLARSAAEATGVTIEADLARDLPTVSMDAGAILQVVRNLTTNALHATPPGGRIGLSTRLSSGRRRVEARVMDTGVGLSDEARAHLFEPFFTTRPDGTGLGLAIAREIMLAHRGDLAVEDAPTSSTGAETSRPSWRTIFLISLPTDAVE